MKTTLRRFWIYTLRLTVVLDLLMLVAIFGRFGPLFMTESKINFGLGLFAASFVLVVPFGSSIFRAFVNPICKKPLDSLCVLIATAYVLVIGYFLIAPYVVGI